MALTCVEPILLDTSTTQESIRPEHSEADIQKCCATLPSFDGRDDIQRIANYSGIPSFSLRKVFGHNCLEGSLAKVQITAHKVRVINIICTRPKSDRFAEEQPITKDDMNSPTRLEDSRNLFQNLQRLGQVINTQLAQHNIKA